MADSIHQAYVTHLLQGGGLVKTRGGKHLAFHSNRQTGGGFWGDLWGKAKSFANKVIPTVVDTAKGAVSSAVNSALGAQGGLKDRLKAGLQGGISHIQSRKGELLDDTKKGFADTFL